MSLVGQERRTQADWDKERKAAKAKAAKVVAKQAKEAEAAKAAALSQVEPEVTTAPVDTDEVEAELLEPEEGYAGWIKADLAAELEERGLPHSGTKDELIARLEEHDGSTE